MEEQLIDDSILDSLWWVIPSKLGGVRKPSEAELLTLKSTGIGAIVSVMDDSANLDLYARLGIPFLWLPVKGGTAPSIDQIKSLYQFMETQNNLGYAVAVHCTSGRRRTGTFLAAYLIAIAKPYDEAIKIIYDANPLVELRAAQTDFLKQLASSETNFINS
jgi:atypical dual specificity phosphatase